MSRDNPLLKHVKEFNPRIPEAERESIDQFTEAGIDLIVDYYNAKYASKDPHEKIYRVIAPMNLGEDIEESKHHKEIRKHQEAANNAIRNIKSLIVSLEEGSFPTKVMLTILAQKTAASEYEVAEERHSVPLLLTDRKIICLRDLDKRTKEILDLVVDGFEREGREMKLIKQSSKYTEAERLRHEHRHDLAPVEEMPKPTSIQGDHKNCTGIAIGILKDLKRENLIRLSELEADYGASEMPAVIYKYSQSTKHITENYPELTANPVKADGTSLMEYVAKHKAVSTAPTGASAISNRISDKMDQMRHDMSILDEDPEGWVGKIMELHEKRKEDKSSVKK